MDMLSRIIEQLEDPNREDSIYYTDASGQLRSSKINMPKSQLKFAVDPNTKQVSYLFDQPQDSVTPITH